MIRPFPLICFCAFAASGAWLYQVKHQVALKDRELVEIRRQTEQARQRMDILRAEWALLNEPDRLRQTAMRVLSLEPMQPQHFARATDMDRRLPGAVAFAGAPNLFAAPPAPEPARGTQPQVMLASTPVAAPAARAAASAAPPAPAQPAAQPGVRVPETPSPQALAAALAAQRAEQASRAAARPPATAPQAAPQPAAPRPVQPAVHVTPGAAPAAPTTRVTRAAEPAPTPTFASALGSASALGRPTLAPPVPVGSASAATLPPPAGR
jgi:hypothetical protein